MGQNLRIIADIFLARIESYADGLKLEWEYHSQNARIWRQYKEVVEDTDDMISQAAEQVHHISIEEQFLSVIETRKIRRAAAKYGVEMPDETGAGNYEEIEWDYDRSQSKYLTMQGMAIIRGQLRQAKTERREAAGFWFGIIVGVIGALTGLLSAMS